MRLSKQQYFESFMCIPFSGGRKIFSGFLFFDGSSSLYPLEGNKDDPPPQGGKGGGSSKTALHTAKEGCYGVARFFFATKLCFQTPNKKMEVPLGRLNISCSLHGKKISAVH